MEKDGDNQLPELMRSGTQSLGRVDSSTLFGERGVLVIEHRGEAYYLRITRNGKLILTK